MHEEAKVRAAISSSMGGAYEYLSLNSMSFLDLAKVAIDALAGDERAEVA
jgi:hypothetical protein